MPKNEPTDKLGFTTAYFPVRGDIAPTAPLNAKPVLKLDEPPVHDVGSGLSLDRGTLTELNHPFLSRYAPVV